MNIDFISNSPLSNCIGFCDFSNPLHDTPGCNIWEEHILTSFLIWVAQNRPTFLPDQKVFHILHYLALRHPRHLASFSGCLTCQRKIIKQFNNQRSKKENLGIWQTNWRIWKTKEMIKEFGNLITSDNTRRQSRRRILQYPLKIIHALSSSGRSAMHVGSFYGGTSCPRWYRHKTNFEYIRTP